MTSRYRIWILWIILMAACIQLAQAQVPPPEFENPSEVTSRSGYFKLSWLHETGGTPTSPYDFELQQSETENFIDPATIYRGPDYASFLSGLKNGIYYYRIRAIDESGEAVTAWSSPLHVTIRHHSLRLTFLLLGIGAIVFLLTVLIIIQGNRQTIS